MKEFSKYMTRDRQKRKNQSDILALIAGKPEITRRGIEAETGFSWGTVSECVTELLAAGYIQEAEATDRNVGRAASVLKLRGDRIVSIGLDVNLSGLTARIVGFDGTKLRVLQSPLTGGNQEEVLCQALELCEQAVAICEEYRLFSIGIAMQGNVDVKSGVSLWFPQIPDWEPVNIRELFSERFGVFTLVEHDPKCMLYAKNIRQKMKDGMLLRVDTGVGLSVMQDGKILDDSGKMELGHTIAVRNGARCACGKRGCLEAYASIRGMTQRTGQTYEKLLEEGNEELFRQAADFLAIAMHNACMLFAPQRIILTGLLMEEKRFVTPLLEAFRELESGEQTRVEVDLNISASYGAAMQSIREAIKNNAI